MCFFDLSGHVVPLAGDLLLLTPIIIEFDQAIRLHIMQVRSDLLLQV